MHVIDLIALIIALIAKIVSTARSSIAQVAFLLLQTSHLLFVRSMLNYFQLSSMSIALDAES